MYLKNIKLWNFRKFGSNGDIDPDKPNLDLNFQKTLNVIIGANDAGKTAIIDAIKLVLKTHSYEYIRVDNNDFYGSTTRLRIELRFEDLKDEEAKNFIEWLGYEENKPYLRLIYEVNRTSDRIIPSEVKAGVDSIGSQLTAEAREYLKITYLKPLRDAENELIAKKYSRVSQVLIGDEAFKEGNEHYLVEQFAKFNKIVEEYFQGTIDEDKTKLGKKLKDKIDGYIKGFYKESTESQFDISKNELRDILEKISIFIKDERNLGLGTLNRLFMATELLHLSKENYHGLHLGIIEELEAHLHPQAQMKVIEKLQKEEGKQLILTSHSPNLTSKLNIENLIICNNNNAYSMAKGETNLKNTDYAYLKRFLDVTKSNLFFAKGVILVEGWTEEILIPTLAKLIGKDLTEKEVSVVNVGNTAFLRYVDIFKRSNLNSDIGVKVSVITDLDLRPEKYATEKSIAPDKYKEKNIISEFNAEEEKDKKTKKYESENIEDIKAFISPAWTLEYCISKSKVLRKYFFEAVLSAHLEQKIDECKTRATIKDYINAKNKIDEYFNSWDDSGDEIAFNIYWQILGEDNFVGTAKDKISKAIIAQKFTEIIEEKKEELNIDELKEDENIKYLIEAINHACS